MTTWRDWAFLAAVFVAWLVLMAHVVGYSL